MSNIEGALYDRVTENMASVWQVLQSRLITKRLSKHVACIRGGGKI